MPRESTITAPKLLLAPELLLTLAALLAILPLLLHGNSCGQDLTFHLQSWLDASHQLRHLHYPRWDATAAWNAGEPRFLFYPPISWLLGAALTLVLPISAAPIVFIFIAVLLSGLSFHHLARLLLGPRNSPPAALIASAFYLANPYMLFNAFERSALAELLAAAWIPLLLLAVLRPRPTLRDIAIPLSLLWLTNIPAAVMGSYLLALLAALRILHALRTRNHPLRLTLTCLSGTLLGLTLPAFYLLPAVFERRFIQSDMAIIPPLNYQDNFLFTHTADAAHNAVNHTASLLALALLLLTAAILAALLLGRKPPVDAIEALPSPAASISPAASPASLVVIPAGNLRLERPPLPLTLALLTLLVAFLLTPISAPVWSYLPELSFLQFPWRLLTILTPILALALALLLDRLLPTRPKQGAPFIARPHRAMGGVAIIFTTLLPLALSVTAHHLYSQNCDPAGTSTTLAHNFATHHGILPTDEYTPTTADNDILRTDDPGFWLAPLGAPNAPAPNTVPTATEINPSIETDDTPVPLSQTLSTPAPHHLTLNLARPRILVLNLRAYPNWRITLTHSGKLSSPSAQDPGQGKNPVRSDGLLAIALPSGASSIDIAWRATPDQTIGLALSAFGLLLLALTFRTAHNSSPAVRARPRVKSETTP